MEMKMTAKTVLYKKKDEEEYHVCAVDAKNLSVITLSSWCSTKEAAKEQAKETLDQLIFTLGAL